MDILTLSAKGQCTFNKQLLAHLGAQPGDQIVIKKLSDGSLQIQTYQNLVPLSSLQGCITSAHSPTDEDIQAAIQEGYIQSGLAGLADAK